MKITVDIDQAYAPGSYLICLVTGKPGTYDWTTRDESRTELVQSDSEFPSLAQTFGYTGNDIDGAVEFLDDNLGLVFVEDPGYF